MSRWEKYRASRISWGINVLGSFCVEIEGSDGTVGFATGFGGKINSLAKNIHMA
jgi:L-rhamnonate dehydratase